MGVLWVSLSAGYLLTNSPTTRDWSEVEQESTNDLSFETNPRVLSQCKNEKKGQRIVSSLSKTRPLSFFRCVLASL